MSQMIGLLQRNTTSGYSDNLVTLTLFPCPKGVTVIGDLCTKRPGYRIVLGYSKSRHTKVGLPRNKVLLIVWCSLHQVFDSISVGFSSSPNAMTALMAIGAE